MFCFVSYGLLLFLFFSKPPTLDKAFSTILPNEIPDKHKSKLVWQSYIFIFKRLKNNVKWFFYKQNFYKEHQAEI